MDKKYEMTDETKVLEDGRVLHRIRALRDIEQPSDGAIIVRKDELGGWIENETNLSQDGCAWVGGDAYVYENAVVRDSASVNMFAKVYGNAVICDCAYVSGLVQVYGNAVICDCAYVSGLVQVYRKALIGDYAWVAGRVCVYDQGCVCGYSRIDGNARIYGNAVASGHAYIFGDARVCDNASVSGNAAIYSDAKIYGNAGVRGLAVIKESASISKDSHYFTIGPIGSRDDFTTFYRGENGEIYVSCGCFNGSIPEFLDKVEQTHGDNIHALTYGLAAVLAVLKIDPLKKPNPDGRCHPSLNKYLQAIKVE